jgi:hypothetical protein
VKEKPKATVRSGYGIVYNQGGNFWSRDCYDTPEAAKERFDTFWQSSDFGNPPPWADYTVVKVKQTLTYVGPAE